MRKLIAIAFAAMLGATLTGCSSYRPLYGSSGSAGPGVVQQLSGIAIEEQSTRAGQLVRNELISSLGGGGGSRYVLKMAVTERKESLSPISGTKVERFRYRVMVTYQLVDAGSGKELTAGKSFSMAEYDTVREPVSDLQAAENARDRATRELGQDLRLRVSAYFATQDS